MRDILAEGSEIYCAKEPQARYYSCNGKDTLLNCGEIFILVGN